MKTKSNTQSSCCLAPASMRKEEILSAKSLTVVATVLALMLCLASAATAQSEALRRLYEASATIPTNIEGIRTYPAPPEGFDALTASDDELAAYGIPLRPDKVRDPSDYQQWTRVAMVMSNPRTRWYGELKPRKAHSSLGRVVPSASGTQGSTFGTTSVSGPGWSGVVNTIPGTKWSSQTSFSWVKAEFPVPWPQQAFNGSGGNICDGDTDQVANWVGLGGLTVTGLNLGNQNNIAQVGVDGYFSCGDGTSQGLFAWVEWFPADLMQLFDVAGGDDVYVYVHNTSAKAGNFTITDFTHQQSFSGLMVAPSGVELVGNEAEFIVERPGRCLGCGLYPLANYVWSIWDFSLDKTFAGTEFGPGEISPATFHVSMTDDSGKNIISVPSVDQGLQQMSVMDQGCARSGGCTP